MKKIITLLMMMTAFSASSYYNCGQYGWFNIEARCNINGATARCTVVNRCSYPMYCEMEGLGQTRQGYYANGQVSGTIYAGNVMYLNINANNPYYDPLVRAYANAQCRF